jgi:signal transduction histidine kinase
MTPIWTGMINNKGRSTPIFVRLSVFLLAMLVVLQFVGALTFVIISPPPSAGMHISAIADRLRAASVNGFQPRVEANGTARPPADRSRVPRLETVLAKQLARPVDRIRFWRIPSSQPKWLADDLTAIDPLVLSGYIAGFRTPTGWVYVRGDVKPPDGMVVRIVLWVAVSSIIVAPIGFVFSLQLTKPIAALANAAERLGRDPSAPPLVLKGPAEIERAVGAFNNMQSRLSIYVADRLRMVGAIAHDLRTPLTRLRLQAQAAPAEQRTRMEGEIAQMERMISGVLEYVRDVSQPQSRLRLHVLSLVEAVADDLVTVGVPVTVEAGPDPVINADPMAWTRMLTNLIENAAQYGGVAMCRVLTDTDSVVIEIDDHGPGIDPDDIERMFEPFERGDASRNLLTGGVGLGLCIVRSVARAHGGDVFLSNRSEGGLRASVRLPT